MLTMPERGQIPHALRLAPIVGWLVCGALPLLLADLGMYGRVWGGSLGTPLYAIGLAAALLSVWFEAPTARVLAWVLLVTMVAEIGVGVVVLATSRFAAEGFPVTAQVAGLLNLALMVTFVAILVRVLWVRPAPQLIDLAPPDPDDLPINRPAAPTTGAVWRRAGDAADGAPPVERGTLVDKTDPWRRGAPGVSQPDENRS